MSGAFPRRTVGRPTYLAGNRNLCSNRDHRKILEAGDLVAAPRADLHVLRTPTPSTKIAVQDADGRILFEGGVEQAVIGCLREKRPLRRKRPARLLVELRRLTWLIT